MFLNNHDMVRVSNSLESKGLSFEKMAASIYMLMPGNSFIYYGEEIGITSPKTEGDENYRTPMIWDSDSPPDINVNGQSIISVPKWGGVKQQEDDECSLLNFYKRIIKIKNQNPQIARGEITETVDFDDKSICAYYIECDGETLLIIHNLSSEEDKTLTISKEIMESPKVRGDLSAGATEEKDTHISLNGDSLFMPAQSTVILKSE